MADQPNVNVTLPRSKLFGWLLVFILAAFVLLATADNRGFERGHHGWVSAHALAIAAHATPDAGWLGYSVQSKSDDGETTLHYFDRYPVWTSAIFGAVLASHPAFSEQIQRTRLVMNLFFVATLALAVLLLHRLFGNLTLAIAASLLAMSGYYAMFYRDMVHFDQPAVLGILLCLLAILRYEQTGRLLGPALLLFVAASSGRSYAVAPTIAAWCLYHLILSARTHGLARGLYRWMRNPPMLFGLYVFALLCAYLVHNTAHEAARRDVTISETSIVKSAARRIGTNARFASERQVPLTWQLHAETQLHRVTTALVPYPALGSVELRDAIPYYVKRLGVLVHTLILLACITLIVAAARRLGRAQRVVFVLMALSGWLWLIPMKNLAIPHEYTSLYQLGFLLAAIAGLLRLLPVLGQRIALGISVYVFVAGIVGSNDTHVQRSQEARQVTADFEAIASYLLHGDNVHVAKPYDLVVDNAPDIVPGAPYAVAYYLSGQYLVPKELASYIVSRDSQRARETSCLEALTPTNVLVYLYRVIPDCQGNPAADVRKAQP